MTGRCPQRARRYVALLACIACAACAAPPAASAFNPLKPICGLAGLVSGIAGKACSIVQHPGKVLKAGKKLLGGHLGGAAKTLLGSGGGVGSAASTAIGLAAIGAWVLGGAKFALDETAKVLGQTTSPQLGTTWFSSAYWRMAGIAAVLTLPFVFAAAVQALMRSDLALLVRSTLGYLPLALLAVALAAPLTMLLLAATDQLSAIASSAAGHASTHFLARAGLTVGVLSFFHGSPFLAFLIGVLAAAGAIVLWLELLMREAAVYVVVLMLPLAFAALVWPARRVWAIRAVELLIALILSKFAIVAVLALGGAALGAGGTSGVTGSLAGAVLVLLGTFAPWALLRLLPLSELASAAAGPLRGEAWRMRAATNVAGEVAGASTDWVGAMTAQMRRQADEHSGAGTQEGAVMETERLRGLSGRSGTGSAPADPAPPAPAHAGHAGPHIGTAQPLTSFGPGNGNLSEAAPPASQAAGPAASTPAETSDQDAGPATGDTGPAQRRPGMLAIWQAADEDWRSLVLGHEEDWPASLLDSGGEHRDPLPPVQDPEEGRL